jgi:hypothetical protein
MVQGEDGLDDGGQSAGRAAGLPQDVPALKGGGVLLAKRADLTVVPVEQLLAFAELAALLSLVGGGERAADPDVAFVGVAGDRAAGEHVDDAIDAGVDRCQSAVQDVVALRWAIRIASRRSGARSASRTMTSVT